MPWYGGQNGARRAQSRKEISEAFSRFEASLGSSDKVDIKDFANNLNENRDFDTCPLLLVDWTPQDSLISQINDATKDKVAIAVAFSHLLEKLDDISDDVCQALDGLFLFCTINITKGNLLHFIRRCPNLKSLSLIQVDDFDKYFLRDLFANALLPKLEFLEVSNANDEAIAAMHTAPNLRKIVFRWPDPNVTDSGFKRLVHNGGAKNLVAISSGSLPNDLSKSLSKSFLMATLPKFVSGEAHEYNLEHISVGKRIPSFEMQQKAKHAEHDSRPFAVIPPERMSFKQLREAFKNRGVSDIPPSIIKMRAALVEMGFTMEQEQAIQATRHADHLSSMMLPPLQAEIKKVQAKIMKVEKNQSAKLYPDLFKTEMESILNKVYKEKVPSSWTRDDVANALHQKGYQGGGTGTAHITFLKQELTRLEKETRDVINKIELLRADTNKYFHQKKAAKPVSGAIKKRPLAHVN